MITKSGFNTEAERSSMIVTQGLTESERDREIQCLGLHGERGQRGRGKRDSNSELESRERFEIGA